MNFKSVAKSKSSNGAVGNKGNSNKKNKSCFSNAALQTSVVKKRGVYVEKKIQSSTDTQETKNNPQIQKKYPRRPRAGQKQFLTSVLKILSKSSTGTQHPEIQDGRNDPKIKFKPEWKTTDDNFESKLSQKTKKTKYKSRVLNDDMLKANQDQLVILQPKKDIVQTPSNSSFCVKPAIDNGTFNADLNEPKRNPIREILENTYGEVAEGITEDVFQGKPKVEKKLRIVDEPETIAAEIAEKDNKNIYNFFVDLLETTFSVYNVKTDYELSDISDIAFEIDDSIVKKLEIKKDVPSQDNLSYTSKYTIDTDAVNFNKNVPIDLEPLVYRNYSPLNPKIRTKSFLNTRSFTKKAKSAPKSKSFDNDNKYTRKSNKKQIINLLKEELLKDYNTYSEPDNLYDALKVMAKNNRRNEKSLRFANKTSNLNLECMFQRHKVISFGTKKKTKAPQNRVPSSVLRNQQIDKQDFSRNFVASRHSLEVVGYDYELPVTTADDAREKRIILNYNISPSISGSLLGSNSLINCALDSSSISNA